MPRGPRQFSPYNFYHIVIRGVNQQLIFIDSADRHKYLDILAEYVSDFQAVLYAFCLMNNHLHLVIYVPDGQISQLFHHINTRYAQWFNVKYDRSGPLQEGRFFSVPILSENQLLRTIRYVHQNPLKAGLEKQPGKEYFWSSMHDYLAGHSELVDCKTILDMLGGMPSFIEFHKIIEAEDLEGPVPHHRLNDDAARQLIEKITGCRTPFEFQRLPFLRQREMVNQLSKKGISIRQLNRLTGIPRKAIDKMVKKTKS